MWGGGDFFNLVYRKYKIFTNTEMVFPTKLSNVEAIKQTNFAQFYNGKTLTHLFSIFPWHS